MRLRSAWGLDIGNSTVKLAHVEEVGGQLHVQTFGPIALPPEPATPRDEVYISALRRLLVKAGSRRGPFAVALPRSTATLKFPEMPRTSEEQAAQMVRFEAQRYIPFAVEDVILSFQGLTRHTRQETTTQGAAEQIEYMLVAVRREIVSEYRDSLDSAGVDYTHLSLSTMGLWNVLHQAEMTADPDEALVVVDIGGLSSTVTAFHAGEMVFNRSANIGGDTLTSALMRDGCNQSEAEARKRDVGLETMEESLAEAPLVREATVPEEWASNLVSEIRRSLAAFRGERRGIRVERLYLCGGGAKTPGLIDYIERAMDMPTEILEVPGLVADPQFVEAVGMAIGAMERGVARIDLVQEEFARERRRRRQRLQMRLAALAGILVLIGAIMFGIKSLQTQQANAARVQMAQTAAEEATREADAAETEYQKLVQQAEILKTALQPEYPWLDVLQDISDRAPRNIWLAGIDLEKGKPLSIRGTAMDQANVQAFWSNLSRSPILVRPNLSYANQGQIAGQTVFQFGITSDISGNSPRPSRPAKETTARRSRPNSITQDAVAESP